MELVFGYLAGLLTLINPCVLPVLPIVLATALSASRMGPVALAAGMSLAFVFFGLTIALFGQAIGLSDTLLSQIGAFIMLGFGLILIVPSFRGRFATATAGIAGNADTTLDGVDRSSLRGQFIGGILLGAVWSPCIGPTLGGAISLASQGQNIGWATAIMVSFAMGVSTLILGLAYGAKSLMPGLRRVAQNSQSLMGYIFIIVGLAIIFRVNHLIDIWAIQVLPFWLQDLSIRF